MAALKNARHERFYVYELVDPRDGQAFYVGKGCGQRAQQHEKAERAGRERNPLKAERLGQIRRASLRPTVRIVQDNLTEEAALRLERGMIVQGHARLTNISMGNRSPMEIVRATARDGLAQMKPLCALLRSRPTALQVRVWKEVVTNLGRMSVGDFTSMAAD